MKRVLLVLQICVLLACVGCQQASTSQRPLIGITSVYYASEDGKKVRNQVGFAYVRAVADNDGVPLVLPTVDDEQIIERYLEVLDGLVLIGGYDIPPVAYGEQSHETVEPLPAQRYDFERKLIARWLVEGKPLLGVCLGAQFTNVVSGGSLIQDIPSQVGTTVIHKGYHAVQIEEPSILSEALGDDRAMVFSSHHQAVKDVGANLRVIARSPDGVVEALQRTDGPFGLFVQWHPESMTDTAHRDAIYGALIEAAETQP